MTKVIVAFIFLCGILSGVSLEDSVGSEEGCGCNKLNRNNLKERSTGDIDLEKDSCQAKEDDHCQLPKNDKMDTQDDSSKKADHDRALTLSVLRSNPMVKIPGGTFFMGTDKPFIPADGESPLRETLIDTFYLDKMETSNAEFARFVAETNYTTEVSFGAV